MPYTMDPSPTYSRKFYPLIQNNIGQYISDGMNFVTCEQTLIVRRKLTWIWSGLTTVEPPDFANVFGLVDVEERGGGEGAHRARLLWRHLVTEHVPPKVVRIQEVDPHLFSVNNFRTM